MACSDFVPSLGVRSSSHPGAVSGPERLVISSYSTFGTIPPNNLRPVCVNVGFLRFHDAHVICIKLSCVASPPTLRALRLLGLPFGRRYGKGLPAPCREVSGYGGDVESPGGRVQDRGKTWPKRDLRR